MSQGGEQLKNTSISNSEYQIEDLVQLKNIKDFDELALHLFDIRPVSRQEKWQEIMFDLLNHLSTQADQTMTLSPKNVDLFLKVIKGGYLDRFEILKDKVLDLILKNQMLEIKKAWPNNQNQIIFENTQNSLNLINQYGTEAKLLFFSAKMAELSPNYHQKIKGILHSIFKNSSINNQFSLELWCQNSKLKPYLEAYFLEIQKVPEKCIEHFGVSIIHRWLNKDSIERRKLQIIKEDIVAEKLNENQEVLVQKMKDAGNLLNFFEDSHQLQNDHKELKNLWNQSKNYFEQFGQSAERREFIHTIISANPEALMMHLMSFLENPNLLFLTRKINYYFPELVSLVKDKCEIFYPPSSCQKIKTIIKKEKLI